MLLIQQPAQERGQEASAIMADNLWELFGQPDIAFHVYADSTALKSCFSLKIVEDTLLEAKKLKGMGAEDFGCFTIEPYIPSVYFNVGVTPQADFDRATAQAHQYRVITASNLKFHLNRL